MIAVIHAHTSRYILLVVSYSCDETLYFVLVLSSLYIVLKCLSAVYMFMII